VPEIISPKDPRLDPNYYAYYYSQRPLDHRLPPPLPQGVWNMWTQYYRTLNGMLLTISCFLSFHHYLLFTISVAQKLGSLVDDDDQQSGEGTGDDSETFRKPNSNSGVTGTTPPSGLKDLLELANGNGEHNGARTPSPPSPLGGKLKSLVDMIQMDFPRTPSPVYQKRDVPQQLMLDQQRGPQQPRRGSLQSSGNFYNDDSNLSSALQNLSVAGNEVCPYILLVIRLSADLIVGFLPVRVRAGSTTSSSIKCSWI
jgi:hypothetical protein